MLPETTVTYTGALLVWFMRRTEKIPDNFHDILNHNNLQNDDDVSDDFLERAATTVHDDYMHMGGKKWAESVKTVIMPVKIIHRSKQ